MFPIKRGTCNMQLKSWYYSYYLINAKHSTIHWPQQVQPVLIHISTDHYFPDNNGLFFIDKGSVKLLSPKISFFKIFPQMAPSSSCRRQLWLIQQIFSPKSLVCVSVFSKWEFQDNASIISFYSDTSCGPVKAAMSYSQTFESKHSVTLTEWQMFEHVG